MMNDTAASYFGAMVESYDSLIRRAVPRYQEMLERLIDYLPDSASRILELGCGTGNLSLALARKYPGAEITMVDAAPEMLEGTRKRLSERGIRVKFLERRFEELDSSIGPFDLITSSISLHHVHDKASLYRNLREVLDENGTFRFADQLRGATPWNHEKNWSRWLEFCRMRGNCSDDEIESLLDHAAVHDHYTPLREHFALLTAAGFGEVDCVWRNWIWGIVTADA